jgi:DNA replication protein DnaC
MFLTSRAYPARATELPPTAAEELLEIVMRRYGRASTLLTSNRPVEDWGKLLGDIAAVTAMLDRLLHHGHVLKCGPRSWRTTVAHYRRKVRKGNIS